MRALLALLAFVLLVGARDPILVPDVSQHEIRLRQGFTGTELLLFGAILNPDGTRAGRDYDIVVVLKGPTQSVIVREKQKVAGIWVNADSAEFRSAPAYFALASSRPRSGSLNSAAVSSGKMSTMSSTWCVAEPSARLASSSGEVALS